jgi:hypothetical protein
VVVVGVERQNIFLIYPASIRYHTRSLAREAAINRKMGTAKKTRKFGLVSRADLELLDLTFSYCPGQTDYRPERC